MNILKWAIHFLCLIYLSVMNFYGSEKLSRGKGKIHFLLYAISIASVIGYGITSMI